jgi:hypothetical protein
MKGCFLLTAEEGDCVEGPNRTFFGVSKGSSFHCISSAIVFLLFAVWVLRAFVRDGGISEDRFEIVTITGIIVAIQALGLAAPWGSLSTTLDYLDCDEHPETLPRNGPVVLKCGHFESTAAAICVLSSIIFCTSTAIVSMAYMWDRDLFSNHQNMTSGGISYESMASVSSPSSTIINNNNNRRGNNNNIEQQQLQHHEPPVISQNNPVAVVGHLGGSSHNNNNNRSSSSYAQSIPGPFSNVNNRTIAPSS